MRPTGFRHSAVTMTHLRKKLILLGTVACVLGTVQTASAAVTLAPVTRADASCICGKIGLSPVPRP